MKNAAWVLFLIITSIIKVSATEQIPDLLLIEKDTFYLKTFPLEQLRVKERIKNPPFEYGDYGFPHTACYRGYVATWKVIDNKLMLIEIEKVGSGTKKLDIIEYFNAANIEPTMINGFVHADWYSDTLKRYDFFNYHFNPEKFYLSVDYVHERDRKVELVFNNGELSYNNITPIESYKKGDILTTTVRYNRQWFLKRGLTRVDAVIKENNGNLVRVKIKDFGTKKKSAVNKIKQMMDFKEGQEYWINPRYWDKKNE